MNLSAEQQRQQKRQREHRHRVLKGGSILQTINDNEIKVTIRNMHDNGAELRVPVGVKIPPEFLLYISIDGIGYRSVVRWREGNRIGVQFLGKEPKPSWHYG